MIEVIAKVDEIINQIDNDIVVKRLKDLKKNIDSDEKIQDLLNAFSVHKKIYEKDLIITEDLKVSKERLYNNPVVAEYRKLYNELSISLARFNRSIIKALDTKSDICSRI